MAPSLLGIVLFPCQLRGDTPPSSAPPVPPESDYRERASRDEGDAAKGRALFDDKRAVCSECHTIDGSNRLAGPDLAAAGDKFSRADLIESVLDPSSRILMGFATTVVVTKSGEQVAGIVKSATERELVLAAAGNARHTILRSDIAEQATAAVSLMPQGLHRALTVAEFTDLIAFLETLKQPGSRLANEAGTPDVIESIASPVKLVALNGEGNRFEKPVWFGEHPTIPGTFVVAEKSKATLSLMEPAGDGGVTVGPFLDIRDEVFVTNDEGLLGVAFHPGFRENRKYYFMHEAMEGTQRSMVIGERIARPDHRADSGDPTRVLLRFDVPTEVHHGGGIEFGPDNCLYIGVGDTGPQEDPQGHAQDLGDFGGKLLRIDVDRAGDGKPYAIPADNPFAGHPDPGVLREIFASGLRQPWRFSWDPANPHHLWVGDVGQNRFEEITMVRKGENHGWNVFEGFELFSTQYRKDDAAYVPPVVSFRRKHGASVTAGFVYRARPESSFHGVFICGDYEKKHLWGITQRDRKLEKIRLIGTSPDRIVAFGRDRAGELYVVGYDTGTVFRIDFTGSEFR